MRLDKNTRSKYQLVIGLEVHVQLQSQSKIFAADLNQYGGEPNTHISPITLAHPGTLPLLNKRVVEYAIKMGLACNCEITQQMYFDRKNYFYPDLPKGYQITQDKTPICQSGRVPIRPNQPALRPEDRSTEVLIHQNNDPLLFNHQHYNFSENLTLRGAYKLLKFMKRFVLNTFFFQIIQDLIINQED